MLEVALTFHPGNVEKGLLALLEGAEVLGHILCGPLVGNLGD